MGTGGWWDEIEEPAAVAAKAERLANVLAPQAGTREEHVRWCEQHIPLMEAELEREGIDPADSRRFGGGMKSLALRWWRNHMKTSPRVPVFETMQEPDRAMTAEEKAQVQAAIAETRRHLRRIG